MNLYSANITTRYFFVENCPEKLNEQFTGAILAEQGLIVCKQYKALFIPHESDLGIDVEQLHKDIINAEQGDVTSPEWGNFCLHDIRRCEVFDALRGSDVGEICEIILTAKRGLPDFLVYNRAKREVFFAEIKTEGDSPSIEQVRMIEKLSKYIRSEIFFFFSDRKEPELPQINVVEKDLIERIIKEVSDTNANDKAVYFRFRKQFKKLGGTISKEHIEYMSMRCDYKFYFKNLMLKDNGFPYNNSIDRMMAGFEKYHNSF